MPPLRRYHTHISPTGSEQRACRTPRPSHSRGVCRGCPHVRVRRRPLPAVPTVVVTDYVRRLERTRQKRPCRAASRRDGRRNVAVTPRELWGRLLASLAGRSPCETRQAKLQVPGHLLWLPREGTEIEANELRTSQCARVCAGNSNGERTAPASRRKLGGRTCGTRTRGACAILHVLAITSARSGAPSRLATTELRRVHTCGRGRVLWACSGDRVRICTSSGHCLTGSSPRSPRTWVMRRGDVSRMKRRV